MRFIPTGREALLVECDDTDQVVAVHQQLRLTGPEGVIDIVPATQTVLLTFDPRVTGVERLTAQIEASPPGVVAAQDVDTIEIAVRYDGADIAEVAELCGLSETEIVRRHTAGRYVVAFCGFSPGFGYLVGGDPALAVPRRSTPRTKVPAGAVALAGDFTGVYPRQGPGGWQLIGQTVAVLWDLSRERPALLAPGTQVRFFEVGVRR